jgi:hypothetical protein
MGSADAIDVAIGIAVVAAIARTVIGARLTKRPEDARDDPVRTVVPERIIIIVRPKREGESVAVSVWPEYWAIPTVIPISAPAAARIVVTPEGVAREAVAISMASEVAR